MRMGKGSVLSRENTGHKKYPFPPPQETTVDGPHKIINTRIRLIIFFVAEDGEALYSQQK